MGKSENIALVKRGLNAVIKRDFESLRPLLADDTVWVSPYAPELHGPDEVIATMKEWSEGYKTELWEDEGFYADEDRVISLEHVVATRKGRKLDAHYVHVYQLRDGKLARLTEYTAEPQKDLEFMS